MPVHQNQASLDFFQRMTGGLNVEVRQFLDDRPEFFHAMVTAMFEQAGPTSNWVKFQGWSVATKSQGL